MELHSILSVFIFCSNHFYIDYICIFYCSNYNLQSSSAAPAKGTTGVHSGSAGFLASLVNYGNSTLRMKDIMKWEKDSEYFNEHVDKDLMKLFEYSYL